MRRPGLDEGFVTPATSPLSSLEIWSAPDGNSATTRHFHLHRPFTRHTMSLFDPLSVVADVVSEAGIIPDVIPDGTTFTPEALVVVKWPTGKEAMLGNTLTTIDTADEPSVSFTPMQSFAAASDIGYTLVMTDPDAPSRSDPKMGEWRHWVVSLDARAGVVLTVCLGDGSQGACAECARYGRHGCAYDEAGDDGLLPARPASWHRASSLRQVSASTRRATSSRCIADHCARAPRQCFCSTKNRAWIFPSPHMRANTRAGPRIGQNGTPRVLRTSMDSSLWG